MASVNKIILVGNLGRDVEMRTFPSGDQVANVSIATTDKWKDKVSGEPREATEWHRLVFNGRLAEIAGQYLRKGSQVYIEGSLRSRVYQKNDVDHTVVEVRVDEMKMLGGPAQDGGGNQGRGGYDTGAQQPQGRQQPQGNQQTRQQPQNTRQQPQGNSGYGGGNQGNGNQGGSVQRPQARPAGGSGFDNMDDDIPF